MFHPQGILYILYQLSLPFESESKLGFLPYDPGLFYVEKA